MNLSFLKEKGNRYVVFVLLGLLLLVIAIPTTSKEQAKEDETVQTTTENELEAQLKRVLSAMEGVGAVEVMITLEEEKSALFGTETQNAKVCGVVVVAQGAGNAVVETRISNAIQALFSIDAHKISIVKRAIQEGER